MSGPEKENAPSVNRERQTSDRLEVTMVEVSTTAAAACFLLATQLQDPTLQLLVVSVGGILAAGGTR